MTLQGDLLRSGTWRGCLPIVHAMSGLLPMLANAHIARRARSAAMSSRSPVPAPNHLNAPAGNSEYALYSSEATNIINNASTRRSAGIPRIGALACFLSV